MTMFSCATMAAPSSDSEVRVQKVDKLDLVFNILIKQPVYGASKGSGNPPMASASRRPAVGGDQGTGRKLGGGDRGNTPTSSSRGIVSTEDINKRSENYIRDKKRMFYGQN